MQTAGNWRFGYLLSSPSSSSDNQVHFDSSYRCVLNYSKVMVPLLPWAIWKTDPFHFPLLKVKWYTYCSSLHRQGEQFSSNISFSLLFASANQSRCFVHIYCHFCPSPLASLHFINSFPKVWIPDPEVIYLSWSTSACWK